MLRLKTIGLLLRSIAYFCFVLEAEMSWTLFHEEGKVTSHYKTKWPTRLKINPVSVARSN